MGLNKAELINIVAKEIGETKINTEKAIAATFSAIKNELVNGGSFSLIGFGSFQVKERAAKMGKNPRTGASIQIPAKKVVRFKAGKVLAEGVDFKKDEKPDAKKKAKKK